MMIPKGIKLHCEHCGRVINTITKDLSDSEPIRNADDFLRHKVGVMDQKVGGIKQMCVCTKESDIYRLILEVLHAGSV